MRTAIWALVLAVGCSQPDPKTNGNTTTTGIPTGGTPAGTTPGGTPGGTTTFDPACADVVVATWPENGRLNAFYRTTIEFFLNPAPTGSEVLIVADNGVPVPGSTVHHSDRVEFVPDDPLNANTTYSVELQDCPPSVVTWSTSPTGAPIDPTTAIGTVYAVDLDSGRWIEPPGVGSLLTGYLTVDVMVGIEDADASALTVLGGVSEEGTQNQDLCSETVMFPPADFTDNPYFELGPSDIAIGVLGTSIDMYDLFLSGAFRPDFTGMEGATLEGQLDTRGLVPLVDPFGPPDAVCTLLVTFGVTCGPCVSGVGDYCVDAVVDDLAVPQVAGPLIERTATDILNDVNCP